MLLAEATAKAFSSVDQLAFEQIRHDGVVPRFVVVRPLLRLLIDRHLVKIELFVLGLLLDAI